jgi:hypothetical protein
VVVLLVALLVLLPMFYMLSVGPLVWLDGGTGWITENETVLAAYYPLIWALEAYPPLQSVWAGYISLWDHSPPPAIRTQATY